jgi:outer membrane lipopolysaccharide assembly protein LptE/RlpB
MKGTVPIFFLKMGTVPILCLLASCGFQLQGRQLLPPQFAYTYVDTNDEQSDFVGTRKALIASKVNVIPTKNLAA